MSEKEILKNFSKKLQDETDKIQSEAHEMVSGIMKESTKLSYQDAMNVFLFAKLAQQQIMIDMLMEKVKPSLEISQTPHP